MSAIRRLVRLFVEPESEWARIAAERTPIAELLWRWILPLALLAPVATVIGMRVFGRDWNPAHGYQVPSGQILAAGSATFFGIVGSIFLLAAIFVAIAPMFRVRRDYPAALKVATFGSVPVLLAGATLLLPVMAIVALVGLGHSCYLLSVGVRRVLHVPPGAEAEFLGISLVLLSLASAVIGAAAGAFGLI
jgi:hypothetical protein